MFTKKFYYISLTILFMVMISCMFWIYGSRQYEINNLQAEVDILYNHKLNEPFLKSSIVILEAENTQLQQQLDSLNIHYAADELYIDKLESDYLRCEIYANTAELILRNNGIDFVRIDD